MRTRALAAATVMAAVLGTGVATSSGGAVGGTMTLTPDSGPPGTEFVVNGTGCFGDVVNGSIGGIPVSGWSAEPAVDGTWSKQLHIPESISSDPMGNPIPTEPGEYPVFAACELEEVTLEGAAAPAQTPEFQYEEAIFTVTAAPEPEPEPEPEPPAALPEEAAPDFTG
jgi:hypothetical protein